MSTALPVLPLAGSDEAVRYVVIDDEPLYRMQEVASLDGFAVVKVGDYGAVETFLSVHRDPFHVVVLDLCLNRLTGDAAILQGVRAIRDLVESHGARVIVHTADERPEPVARCVAAGAVAYVSKYSPGELAQVIAEVGRHGMVTTSALESALHDLVRRSYDIRLSAPLEETLRLLGRGDTDSEVAAARHLSPRTIEDHKRKIMALFGEAMEKRALGFSDLARELGVRFGDIVNDAPGGRPARGSLASRMPWARRSAASGRTGKRRK